MASDPGFGRTVPPGAPVPPPPGARLDTPRPAVAVGRIVGTTVTQGLPNEVEVRLVDGRTGVIPRTEIDGSVQPGQELEAALLARDDPKGRTVLSRAWAVRQRSWERLESAKESHEPLTGPVTKAVKGGVVLDLGVRAFLPTSLFPEGCTDPAQLVGTEAEVLVVEADREGDRIVVSVRDLERRRRRHRERDLLRSLEAGTRVEGTVVGTGEHGAVVDLGGVRGLVHRSELTWGHLRSVEDVVAVGDRIEVVVLDVQRSKRRVALSLRATTPDPFEGIEPGAVEDATVTRVVDYGAFARLDRSGAEGLVHISELSEVPGARPDQLVVPGEQVVVKVLDVDARRRRLSLSVRQAILAG